MKRILAVILIMIFMTSAVSYAKISHREQPIQKTEYGYKQAEFLQKLGIIAEIPVLHINVTRGKACEVLAKLILPPKANAAESVFSDVTKDTANVKDIVALYSAGYIKGYGDGRFGPDDMLSYNDASTLLCRVLTADDKGMAEPDGLEIYNGVNAEGSLITYADLYIMTVNVLNTKISENQTFLEEKLNVFKYEGVITDNGITALNGKSNISPAELKINEDVYKWGNVADRTLLGMYVSGYYKCTDEENAKMIITADVEELKNKYISVNSSDVKMITDSEIVFMQDGIERRDSISEDSCFIYNGMSVSQNIQEMFDGIKKGDVKLIDRDVDGVYDILIMNGYTTMVVSEVKVNERKIHGKYGESVYILPKKNVFVYRDDKQTDLSDLHDFDVIAIIENESSWSAWVINKAVYGTVSRVTDNKFLINGEEYSLADEYRRSKNLKPGVGSAGIFYITVQNKIAYYENTETSNR